MSPTKFFLNFDSIKTPHNFIFYQSWLNTLLDWDWEMIWYPEDKWSINNLWSHFSYSSVMFAEYQTVFIWDWYFKATGWKNPFRGQFEFNSLKSLILATTWVVFCSKVLFKLKKSFQSRLRFCNIKKWAKTLSHSNISSRKGLLIDIPSHSFKRILQTKFYCLLVSRYTKYSYPKKFSISTF